MTDLTLITYDITKDEVDSQIRYKFWSKDVQGNSVLVRIENYNPYLMIKLPQGVNRPIVWDKYSLGNIQNIILRRVSNNPPDDTEIKIMTDLYPYQHNKYHCIKIYYNNLEQKSYLYKRLNNYCITSDLGNITLEILEDNIDDISKLLTEINLGPTEWKVFKKSKLVPVEDRISKLDREYICLSGNIIKAENINIEPIVKVLSLDIECYNPNHKAIPSAISPLCKMVMFQSSFYQSNQRDKIKRYVFTTLGYYEEIKSELENLTIIYRNHELELVQDFFNLVEELDPDVIIGHNVMDFDINYINDRLCLYGKNWDNITRIKDKDTSKMMGKETASGGGFKKFNIDMLDLEGRIILDTLPIIRLDYSLEDYKLETISNHFLGKGKHDVSPEEMFITVEEWDRIKDNLDYNNQDHLEVLDKTTKFIKYGIQDADLVLDIYEKVNIFTKLLKLANITRIRPIQTFTRGQQLRGINQIYHYCYHNNILVNKIPYVKDKFEGGRVFEPVKGLHKKVVCLDFKSLYPSIIIANNICYTTIVKNRSIPDQDCNVIEFIDNDVKYKMRFIKKDIREGILPRILTQLINERNLIKKKMKSETDETLLMILDVEQWVIKICANSLYGFLKSQTLPLTEGAMATTAWGRMYITQASEYFLDNYKIQTLYGDTDSIMLDFSRFSDTEIHQKAVDFATEVSEIFPEVLVMEMEKIMVVLFIKKKHYGAYFLDKQCNLIMDKDQPFLFKRGIPLSRRDKAPILKELYEKTLRTMLDMRYKNVNLSLIMKTATELIVNFCNKIVQTEHVNIDMFRIVKRAGTNYKDKNFFLAKFVTKMNNLGKGIKPGDAMKYVIIDNGEKNVGDKMVLYEDYHSQKFKLDNIYYLEKVLSKNINAMYYAAFHSIVDKLNYSYLEGRMKKTLDLSEIITIIYKMNINNSWSNEASDNMISEIKSEIDRVCISRFVIPTKKK